MRMCFDFEPLACSGGAGFCATWVFEEKEGFAMGDVDKVRRAWGECVWGFGEEIKEKRGIGQ